VDARDGQVEFTVDTSKVRLNTAGTYYAVYTATDSTGNTTTYRRTVIVNHDSADVDALVKSIAKNLPADAEKLRDYVRNNIRYSHNWGGADPSKGTPEASYVYVWYGFKNKSGNCYVHALCLEALLKEKGFETQLIWATDKSHYWNIVKIDGKWYHIDATPGNRHTKYSLMNDFERYETLYIPEEKRQRDWDRTKWPRCL
jgi:transglutaminase-like putative cysteine protease